MDVLGSAPLSGGAALAVAGLGLKAVIEWIKWRRDKELARKQSAIPPSPQLAPPVTAGPAPDAFAVRLDTMERAVASWRLDELEKTLSEVSADQARTASALSAERRRADQAEAEASQLRVSLAAAERELALAKQRAEVMRRQLVETKHERASTHSTQLAGDTPLPPRPVKS